MKPKIDFIGIGAAKSGTTTISQLLKVHPQICVSKPKEIKYFNSSSSFYLQEKINPNSLQSLDWYMSHYKHCSEGSIKGEFTPHYFIDPDAPKRIYDIFPAAKLIVCLRNPVDRAYSHFQMLKNSDLNESRSFGQAIKEEPEYIEKGLYHKHLLRYLAYFKMENILILTFEEIKSTPLKTVQKLYEFLEVDGTFIPKDIHVKANSSKKARSKSLKKIASIVKTMGGNSLINGLKETKMFEWFRQIYFKPYNYPPMKEEDRVWLKKQFQTDIEQLEELLQKDFSHWK